MILVLPCWLTGWQAMTQAREAKLKRNPDALGRNWDCQGDCQGGCMSSNCCDGPAMVLGGLASYGTSAMLSESCAGHCARCWVNF